MKKAKKSLMDILRRGFRARSAISYIAVSRYPKSWQAQTYYNPVLPGSDRTKPIDMRSKAVEEREKQARNSLIVPIVIIASVILVLVIVFIVRS